MAFIIHGATGAQGSPVFELLTKLGKDAIAAVRNTKSFEDRRSISIDNMSVDSLAEAYAHADGVFIHLPVASESERFQHAINIAKAIRQASPRRVVISTSGWVIDEPGSPLQAPGDSAISTLIREIEQTGISVAVVAPRVFLENLLIPIVIEQVKSSSVLTYPLPENYSVSWVSHQDVAEVVVNLLLDVSISGVVGVGYEPGITGKDIALGFSNVLNKTSQVHYQSVTPSRFGELITPLFGAEAAASVTGFYTALTSVSSNVISKETSAQVLLGLKPRTLEQWMTRLSL